MIRSVSQVHAPYVSLITSFGKYDIPSNEGDVATELTRMLDKALRRSIGQNQPRFVLHVGRRSGVSPF
jgi:hypothetical protein